MKHPSTRAARRHARDTYRTYRQGIIRNWSSLSGDPQSNLWWLRCAKHNGADGCRLCKFEKYSRKYIRKRRRSLDHEIQFSILSFADTLDGRGVQGYRKRPR